MALAAPFVTTTRPPTPVVPISRVNAVLREAEAQALRLEQAAQRIETARRGVALQLAALAREQEQAEVTEQQVFDACGADARDYKVEAILHLVAVASKVPRRELRGPRRCAWTVQARQSYFWLARRFTGRSLPEIGRRCGGKDHTTVLHGARKVERIVASLTAPQRDTPAEWAKVLMAKPWGSLA